MSISTIPCIVSASSVVNASNPHPIAHFKHIIMQGNSRNHDVQDLILKWNIEEIGVISRLEYKTRMAIINVIYPLKMALYQAIESGDTSEVDKCAAAADVVFDQIMSDRLDGTKLHMFIEAAFFPILPQSYRFDDFVNIADKIADISVKLNKAADKTREVTCLRLETEMNTFLKCIKSLIRACDTAATKPNGSNIREMFRIADIAHTATRDFSMWGVCAKR